MPSGRTKPKIVHDLNDSSINIENQDESDVLVGRFGIDEEIFRRIRDNAANSHVMINNDDSMYTRTLFDINNNKMKVPLSQIMFIEQIMNERMNTTTTNNKLKDVTAKNMVTKFIDFCKFNFCDVEDDNGNIITYTRTNEQHNCAICYQSTLEHDVGDNNFAAICQNCINIFHEINKRNKHESAITFILGHSDSGSTLCTSLSEEIMYIIQLMY